MLHLPASTLFGRRIPKQKFYENLDVPPDVRRLFAEQVRLLTWAHKLSPDTLHTAAGEEVQEVEVIHIKLTGNTLDSRVTALLDKQIPYHLIFLIENVDGMAQLVVNYKEAKPGGRLAFQLKKSYETPWMPPEELSLSCTGLDMDAVYERMVLDIAGDALQPAGGGLQEAVAQTQADEQREKQIERLRARMRKEKRLAKQMEIRREIRKLEQE